jgi:hypothetical protein
MMGRAELSVKGYDPEFNRSNRKACALYQWRPEFLPQQQLYEISHCQLVKDLIVCFACRYERQHCRCACG